jgi:acetylornithine deacetylase/succinyl-diaminopimelate desuccinylase-like protein
LTDRKQAGLDGAANRHTTANRHRADDRHTTDDRHRADDRHGAENGRGFGDGYGAFDRYVADHMADWTRELLDFCAIGSEANDPDALRSAAAWTADRLRRLGAEVDVVTLDGVPPLVLGEIGDGPILTAVQHYDVQPAVPLELWTSPPYAPEVRDGRLYARGAADNKGELLARVWAAEAYLATIGPLPCRIRYLVEGEEESGSRHLSDLLALRPASLVADGALIEGGGIDLHGRPTVVGGVRGMVTLELTCRTIAYDAHSSLSNLLPSATIRLVKALATFWDDAGAPAIEGIRAGVREPTAEQLAVVARIPDEDIDDLRTVFRIDRFVGGLEGQAAARVLSFDPTCNIQGLWSGYTGPGGKTITPAEAHARLDIRLVPDQDPEVIAENVKRHLASHGFGDIDLAPLSSRYRAWWSAPDDPIVLASIRVSEAVVGKPAVQDLSMAGTAPMHAVCATHHVPTTSLGGADDECRAHAPDESFRLDYAALAVQMTGRFLDEFAGLEVR